MDGWVRISEVEDKIDRIKEYSVGMETVLLKEDVEDILGELTVYSDYEVRGELDE